jgi:4-amino-4-deoxychorismate lyase
VNDFGQWWVNGVPGDSISVHDRGFTYGDGLFETIAVRDSKPRFLDYHLERLSQSCQRLEIPCPSEIADEVCQLADGCAFGTVKIILTRGVGERSYLPPIQASPTRIIGLMEARQPPQDAYAAGISVRFCKATVSANSSLAGMKTLGRLEQVMARSEWRDGKYREGLMCSDEGRVICGTMTNVFFVDDGNLCTPDLSRCGVNGVMRRVVMERAGVCGVECVEVEVEPAKLRQADEIFLTNSLIGIWPVSLLDGTSFGIGSMTRRLMAELANVGVSECG